MRTSIEIDDRLMREAMRCSGARTKKATVETALQLLVRTYAQGAIARHRGKVVWEGPGSRGTQKLSTRTKGRTDFKRLRQMRDLDIDDSDIPRLDRGFWKRPKLTMP
jgi:Arc/MetJ family transcription regulator